MSVPPEDAFIVDLDGFEGPLDLLLDLARAHKVDLAQISILELAEQFLAYLHGMQVRRLQIAAEYLVMAAWLAYLKSQLLLPPAERELDDAEAVVEDLGVRLRRLEALRSSGSPRSSGRNAARSCQSLPVSSDASRCSAASGVIRRRAGMVMRAMLPRCMTAP